MTLYKWSQTASADATADNTINWAEGQAPSSVNNSARAMMAATAKYRDDIAGAIVTTGTNTSYAVSSYQGFDTLAHLNGQMIAFTPHATNGISGSPGIGLMWICSARSRSACRQGSNASQEPSSRARLMSPSITISDGVFYLQGFYGNPYNVPLGAGLDYWLPTAPNSAFVFPIGQAISRTTYATLFAGMGTTFGTGDGSTTFNLPDKRGRVSAAADPTGTILTSASMTPDGNTLGAKGGAEQRPILQTNFPNINFAVSGMASVTSDQSNVVSGTVIAWSNGSGIAFRALDNNGGDGPITSHGSISGSAASGGSGTPLVTVQPTIMCNYIIRII